MSEVTCHLETIEECFGMSEAETSAFSDALKGSSTFMVEVHSNLALCVSNGRVVATPA